MGDYPISKGRLGLRFALDLIGLGYLLGIVKFVRNGRRLVPGRAGSRAHRVFVVGSVLAMQGILHGSTWGSGFFPP